MHKRLFDFFDFTPRDSRYLILILDWYFYVILWHMDLKDGQTDNIVILKGSCFFFLSMAL